MTAQFTTTRRIEFADTDMAGIVHFACFYRFMEQAEHDFFRSVGLGILNKQPDGTTISWPRVAAWCSFDAPAFFDDVLEVRMNVGRVGTKSLTLEFEFWRDDERIAHGWLKTVCCLLRPGEPMQPIEIPALYREKIAEPDPPTGEDP